MTARRVRVLLVLAALGLTTLAVGAEQKVVVLKNGRRFTGQVTKIKDGYEIKTSMGTVIIGADQVLRIEDAVSPKDEFKRRLARIDPTDIEAMYRLAAWARDNDLLIEARDLLKKILARNPDHENATLLLRLVEISLAGKRPVRPATTRPRVGPRTSRPTIDRSKLLSQEDIYRIRLLELRETDRVSIEFRNKVLERFIESMKGVDIFARRSGERRFRRWPRVRQVMYILEQTDRSDTAIRDDILIKTDPEVMRFFRSRVWPIIQASCARPSCHGGPKGAGKFKLFDLPMTDDRVAYTNFYILHAWSRGGTRMIDRDEPSRSRLLQAGLPQSIAKPGLGHPKPLNPPVFASPRDRNYRLIERWIGSLRSPLLSPGYRVNYTIPNLGKKPTATAPAAEPAPFPGRP